ncbi:MAG TPA: VOC family protein [Devosia sp.]|jgi:catechol 2,3-dioxygenase-like lactoylglutathione lyase family enzyme|nr:VOC family protein [Devosia sp.]
MTPAPNFILAYVADAPRSAELYRKLLGAEPVESSANWAMFAFPNGLALGLWARDEVEPRATLPGGSEIGFPVENDADVTATREAWSKLGLRIIQEPTQMDFGFTFTAADPDGHRLRVFAPSDRTG